MKFNFKRKKLKNYLSYKELTFDYSPGIHLVIGKNLSSTTEANNGSGKTNLFTSTTWCLYEKSTKKDVTNKLFKKDTFVSEEFEVGQNNYEIIRYHKDTHNKNDVKILCNGTDVTHKNKTDNEREIGNILGITHDLFSSSIVVNQGLPITFSKLKPTARKIIIEELVGSSSWDKYRKVSSVELQKALDEYSAADTEYKKIEAEMVTSNNTLEYLKNLEENNQDDLTKEEQDLVTKIETCVVSYQDISKKIEEQKSSEVTDLINRLTTQLNKNIMLISQKEQILRDKICVTCNQPFPEETIMTLAKEKETLLTLNVEIQEQLVALKAKYDVITKMSSQLRDIAHYKNTFDQKLNEIRQKKANNKNLAQIEELTNKINSYLETLTDMSETNEYLKKDFEELKFIDDMFLPSSHFRATVLEKYIEQINTILHDMIRMIFDKVEVALHIDQKKNSIQIKIKRNGKADKYENFSGGEQRKVDIALILSFQRFLLEHSSIQSNLMVFDEIFDGLDEKGVELIVSCLDSLFPDDTCIYVISHNSELKKLFDNVITVIKNDEISDLE